MKRRIRSRSSHAARSGRNAGWLFQRRSAAAPWPSIRRATRAGSASPLHGTATSPGWCRTSPSTAPPLARTRTKSPTSFSRTVCPRRVCRLSSSPFRLTCARHGPRVGGAASRISRLRFRGECLCGSSRRDRKPLSVTLRRTEPGAEVVRGRGGHGRHIGRLLVSRRSWHWSGSDGRTGGGVHRSTRASVVVSRADDGLEVSHMPGWKTIWYGVRRYVRGDEIVSVDILHT